MCLGTRQEVTENKSSRISEKCPLNMTLELVLLLVFSKTIKGGASDFNKFSQLPMWHKKKRMSNVRGKAKRIVLVLASDCSFLGFT